MAHVADWPGLPPEICRVRETGVADESAMVILRDKACELEGSRGWRARGGILDGATRAPRRGLPSTI
jgi:hypothetical protein